MKSERVITIDLMRGLAVILMVALHVGSQYRLDTPGMFSWDYLRFIVPLFVFCSAYIELSRPSPVLNLKKMVLRMKRLIIPYWIYLIIMTAYSVVQYGTINIQALLSDFFLLRLDVIDYSWLVSLFIAFACVIPAIHVMKSKPYLYVMFLIASLTTTALLLFFKTPIPFRLMMWLPWAWVVFEVDLFLKYRHVKWVPPILIGGSAVLFLLSREVLIAQGKSIQLFANKYPPDLYYLSYGSTLMFIAYYGFEISHAFLPNVVKKSILFLSSNSYTYYLIHIFFLLMMQHLKNQYGFSVWLSIIFVLLGTAIAQLALNAVIGTLCRIYDLNKCNVITIGK